MFIALMDVKDAYTLLWKSDLDVLTFGIIAAGGSFSIPNDGRDSRKLHKLFQLVQCVRRISDNVAWRNRCLSMSCFLLTLSKCSFPNVCVACLGRRRLGFQK